MTNAEFESAIIALSKGDKNALKCIYQNYGKFIYVVVFDVLKNKEDAEDITSEFFIKLIRVAGSFKSGSPHKAWMAMIAKNMAIDLQRKKRHEVLEFSHEDDEGNEGVSLLDKRAADNGNVLEESAVISMDMKNAMEKLTDRERQIIDLKLMGQLKFREIADILNEPMGTVTWVYNEGIKKLRRYLT